MPQPPVGRGRWEGERSRGHRAEVMDTVYTVTRVGHVCLCTCVYMCF